MRTLIVVTLQIEALHHWPEALAEFPVMGFLAHPHRHIFHVTAKKEVSHDNRDIEIIAFKRKLHLYLQQTYWDYDLDVCNFQAKSCEMLAKELIEYHDLQYCQVLEDNENGAEVWQ